jgi:hypothetical protein
MKSVTLALDRLVIGEYALEGLVVLCLIFGLHSVGNLQGRCFGAPWVFMCPKGHTFASIVNYTASKKCQRTDVEGSELHCNISFWRTKVVLGLLLE